MCKFNGYQNLFFITMHIVLKLILCTFSVNVCPSADNCSCAQIIFLRYEKVNLILVDVITYNVKKFSAFLLRISQHETFTDDVT